MRISNRQDSTGIAPRPALKVLLIAALTCSLPALLPTARSETISEGVLRDFDVTEEEVRKLESGEVLAFSDEALEFSKRELSADAMVVVDTDHATVLSVMDEDSTIIPVKYLIDNRQVFSEADFEEVRFTEDDMKEVERFFSRKLGKHHNLDVEEQSVVEDIVAPYRNGTQAEKIEAASAAMRSILVSRFNAYREAGLDGVGAYDRSRRKQVDVGAELKLTNSAALAFEDDFPEFVTLLTRYPTGAECCRHEFRWLKVRLHKRPAFALAHTMMQSTDDFALITERYFYVSNSLNSVQITVMWLPYEEGGSLGLAVSASADILDSVMGRMLRPVGRNMARDLVTGSMQDVKTMLEERSQQPAGEADASGL